MAGEKDAKADHQRATAPGRNVTVVTQAPEHAPHLRDRSPRSEPAVRARVARATIQYLDRHAPDARAEFWKRLPRAVTEALRTTTDVGWIPAHLDKHCCATHIAVLGEPEAERVFIEASLDTLGTRLLSNVVKPALRLFGGGPTALMRILPRAWPLAFRSFCGVTVHLGSDGPAASGALVVLDDVAPEVFEHPPYHVVFRAVIRSLVQFAGYRGDVSHRTVDGARRLEFEAAWTPE